MGKRNKVFDYGFMVCGLLIQIITFLIANHLSGLSSEVGWLSLVSGCLGVCSVCLTSQGNIIT
jgi:nicotinamide riboside transporter PnuC